MKSKIFILSVFVVCFINLNAQNTPEEGDYLIITFVKHGIEDIKLTHQRHDWIVCVDSIQTSFTIYPFLGDTYCLLEEDIETLVYKYGKKIQTIKCCSKNGYKEKIYVYVTPIHGKIVKWKKNFYLAVSDIIYTPSILKNKERMKYLYSHYNYVPFTKDEPFKIPDY